MDDADQSTVDSQTGLPNRNGFEAVLEMEEHRSRRHGGRHGLVLVEIDAGDRHSVGRAADAIARAVREIDIVARCDHRTFGVLALHCQDLDAVVARLRANLGAAAVPIAGLSALPVAGFDLGATWAALTGAPPPAPAPRHVAFLAGPVSPN
jgi:GGDEF domain-containing protein